MHGSMGVAISKDANDNVFWELFWVGKETWKEFTSYSSKCTCGYFNDILQYL